ncbi:hypothetical protein [Nitrosopumilus sp.]|uniref:hypothetical protein n=1 Tax=Nitrosopumilus sp. TaxID=2024843 RepID=UPI003D13B8AF
MKTRLLIIIGFVVVGIIGVSAVSPVFASISFDKSTYTWTDKVNIRVTEHGVDSENTSVRIYTSDHELRNYKLSKAGNGLFTGQITLSGFTHDADGDGKSDTIPQTTGNGPNNGFIETTRDDEITISIRFADGDKIKKTAKILWNVGSIDFERLFPRHNESIHIKVTDVDMNLHPDTIDIVPVHVYSDSDKAGITLDAREQYDSPGLFETIFSLSSGESRGDRLHALPNDTVYVQYDDYTLPKPYGINDDLAIITKLHPFPLEPLDDKKIEWSQGNYAVKNGTGTAKIIVTDPQKNTFEDSVETVSASVFSDSSREGIVIDLYETEKNSGIFERTFSFSDKRSAPNILYGVEGDTVTARYSPITDESENVFLVSTMFLGLSAPPVERAPVSSPRIYDLEHNTIAYPVVGEQVLLTSDITSQQNREQPFVWIAQITDSEKKTQALSWINGTLNPQSSFSPTTSWTPQIAGEYQVVFFVWESIDNPSALSPPIELDFTVLDEDPTRHQYEELSDDQILERQNLIEELRIVPRENSMEHLSDDARDFVISEVLQNKQVSSILDGYTYDVECCSFSVDRQNPTLNQHVGLKFHVDEKYLFVTITFDLKQEKITAILKGSSDGFSIMPIDD